MSSLGDEISAESPFLTGSWGSQAARVKRRHLPCSISVNGAVVFDCPNSGSHFSSSLHPPPPPFNVSGKGTTPQGYYLGPFRKAEMVAGKDSVSLSRLATPDVDVKHRFSVSSLLSLCCSRES